MTTEEPSTNGWVIKFVPLSSTVASPFWVSYNREKLERLKLSTDPLPINAYYSCSASRLSIDEDGLTISSSKDRVAVQGTLISFNTVEDFSKTDKNQILRDSVTKQFLKGDIDCLIQTVLLTYSDLKAHKVLFWFGIPAISPVSAPIRALRCNPVGHIWNADRQKEVDSLITEMAKSLHSFPPYFILTSSGCVPLTKSSAMTANDIFAFLDPNPASSTEDTAEPKMGWPLRNLVAHLAFHGDLSGRTVSILSYRPASLGRDTSSCRSSLVLEVTIPTKEDYGYQGDDESTVLKVVGWELNQRGKPGPRSVNLAPLLDHKHLAVEAANLNLQLMKWRMIPSLDVSELQNLNVLILGAGTLGCNVSRTLLGWGVRKFTLVDYGKVSYSNPVRQSLFTLEDCKDGGKSKAEAAADAMNLIAADVVAKGVTLSIPMPGHPEDRETMEKSVAELDALVSACDVVFLLTDTRESRWLPTVMASAMGKPLINAALGLDSWLVMRHGGGLHEKNRYGCYFCNDVVAPENSTKNRTLDQQCTVTRPGLAPIASSMAAELFVSILHHPDGLSAEAPKSSSSFAPVVDSASPLGVIPQQIRGSLTSYTLMTPTVPAFHHCTACSDPIVNAYLQNKNELCWNACNSVDGSFLEDQSGLTAFRAAATAKLDEVDDWNDDVDEDDF